MLLLYWVSVFLPTTLATVVVVLARRIPDTLAKPQQDEACGVSRTVVATDHIPLEALREVFDHVDLWVEHVVDSPFAITLWYRTKRLYQRPVYSRFNA